MKLGQGSWGEPSSEVNGNLGLKWAYYHILRHDHCLVSFEQNGEKIDVFLFRRSSGTHLPSPLYQLTAVPKVNITILIKLIYMFEIKSPSVILLSSVFIDADASLR